MAKDPEKQRETIIARIRALLARTVANGCTEAEAQAASNQVDRLMALYEIDLTEATVHEQEVTRMEIKLDHHPVRYATTHIGQFTDCMAWAERGFLTFLGLDIDTRIAEYLVLTFQRAIDRETGNWAQFNAEMAMMNEAGRKRMVSSFGIGMAGRLGERLKTLKSKRDFEQKTTGFDLVAVKGELVKEAFGTLGGYLVQEGGAAVGDQRAYEAGRSAAEKVSINQGIADRGGPGAGRLK